MKTWVMFTTAPLVVLRSIFDRRHSKTCFEGETTMRAIAYGASVLALMGIAAPAAADTVPFVDTTPGPGTFTAPVTGVYDILAFGGSGGASGGNEASGRKLAATLG